MTKKDQAQRSRLLRRQLQFRTLTCLYLTNRAYRTARPVRLRMGVVGRSRPSLYP